MSEESNKIADLILRWGSSRNVNTKQWVLDQILHLVLNDTYDAVIEEYNNSTDEMGIYYDSWDEGISPL
jgi:hypothetical protein